MEAGISDRRDAGYIVRPVEDTEAEEGLMAEKDRNGTQRFFLWPVHGCNHIAFEGIPSGE
jgi:hypothetical protein